MTSLTRTAIIARKIIRYTIYGVILIIVGKFLIRSGVSVYRHFFPEPPPPPTIAFGRLPSIDFPKNTEIPSLEYVLETPNGAFPTFPEQVKVYFMPPNNASLLSLDSAKRTATALGFSQIEEKLSDTIYKFPHSREPSSLEINIITGVFSISYDLSLNPSIIDSPTQTPEVAFSQISSYLNSADLLPEDMSENFTHLFLKIDQNGINPAVSLSEANMTKINLQRKIYDNIPSVTQETDESNVWFMTAGSRGPKQVIAAEYRYFPIDEETFATYPLKTAQEAWEEMKNGGAYFANLNEKATSAVVRRVYLAYYDPGVQSEFYQPVIVFEGDNDFAAYIPAVTTQYYGD